MAITNPLAVLLCLACAVFACHGVSVPLRHMTLAEWQQQQFVPSAVSAAGAQQQQSRIVGGALASIAEVPFIASLFVTETLGGAGNVCGGSLISARWVLTAGHCFNLTSDRYVYVGVNTSSSVSGGRLFVVPVAGGVTRHPGFVLAAKLVNDVALVDLTFNLTVATPLVFGAVSPRSINLNINASFPKSFGDVVRAAGWGVTQAGDPNLPGHTTTDDLRVVALSTANQRTNLVADPLCDTINICTSTNGKDTCVGDSGGPLYSGSSANNDLVLLGITSWGPTECASTNPSAELGHYTRISDQLAFIHSVTGLPAVLPAGICTADADCVAPDSCHTAGACNVITGKCSSTAKPELAVCGPSKLCRSGVCGEACPAGSCVAANVCQVGFCNPLNGSCTFSSQTNGVSCGTDLACLNGSCQPKCLSVPCAAPGACRDFGVCNSISGVCSFARLSNGTACAGNTGTCASGVCVDRCAGVVCLPADVCHTAGRCNSTTGKCSSPIIPDGTSCESGNVCKAGVCTDLCAGVKCAATTGLCDSTPKCVQATGLCVPTYVANDTSCGKISGFLCRGGVCTDLRCSGKNCLPKNTCQLQGTCAAGVCTYPNKADKTPCGVRGDAFLNASFCKSGVCVADRCFQRACPALGPCSKPGVCLSESGLCEYTENMPDGSACGASGICGSGRCVETENAVCARSDECDNIGDCWVTACSIKLGARFGVCNSTKIADGRTCSRGLCMDGQCVRPVLANLTLDSNTLLPVEVVSSAGIIATVPVAATTALLTLNAGRSVSISFSAAAAAVARSAHARRSALIPDASIALGGEAIGSSSTLEITSVRTGALLGGLYKVVTFPIIISFPVPQGVAADSVVAKVALGSGADAQWLRVIDSCPEALRVLKVSATYVTVTSCIFNAEFSLFRKNGYVGNVAPLRWHWPRRTDKKGDFKKYFNNDDDDDDDDE